jgi:hypothetical protein
MTGHFLPFAISSVLENDILAIVKGMDPRDIEAIHDKIWWKLNPRCLTDLQHAYDGGPDEWLAHRVSSRNVGGR